MDLTIEIEPEMMERLKVQAALEGVEPSELAYRYIHEYSQETSNPNVEPRVVPGSTAEAFADIRRAAGGGVDFEVPSRDKSDTHFERSA